MTSGGNLHQPGLDGADTELDFDIEDLLHPDEQRRFRRLCIDTSAEELEQLTEVVGIHLDHVRTNAGPSTDVETAVLVAEAATKLLAFSRDFDRRDRALVRGAIEYFILNDDASDDLEDVLGFDDDARVFNSVLHRIGRAELKVRLPG
ncbi:MAG: hypothetical protein OEZ14_13820 [Acidimicrobiia bacterium]|nr:hypothetical protein [Acidimicrobiia bacterium]MDH5521597.1 hypothetical protein [Acidimicrobiia bacterium]